MTSAMVCSVLPRPISSARIAPCPGDAWPCSSAAMPVTASYRKRTPSTWWGRSTDVSSGSSTTSTTGIPRPYSAWCFSEGRRITTAPGAAGS